MRTHTYTYALAIHVCIWAFICPSTQREICKNRNYDNEYSFRISVCSLCCLFWDFLFDFRSLVTIFLIFDIDSNNYVWSKQKKHENIAPTHLTDQKKNYRKIIIHSLESNWSNLEKIVNSVAINFPLRIKLIGYHLKEKNSRQRTWYFYQKLAWENIFANNK